MTVELIRKTHCPHCGHDEARQDDADMGRHQCTRYGWRFHLDEQGNLKEWPTDESGGSW